MYLYLPKFKFYLFPGTPNYASNIQKLIDHACIEAKLYREAKVVSYKNHELYVIYVTILRG